MPIMPRRLFSLGACWGGILLLILTPAAHANMCSSYSALLSPLAIDQSPWHATASPGLAVRTLNRFEVPRAPSQQPRADAEKSHSSLLEKKTPSRRAALHIGRVLRQAAADPSDARGGEVVCADSAWRSYWAVQTAQFPNLPSLVQGTLANPGNRQGLPTGKPARRVASRSTVLDGWNPWMEPAERGRAQAMPASHSVDLRSWVEQNCGTPAALSLWLSARDWQRAEQWQRVEQLPSWCSPMAMTTWVAWAGRGLEQLSQATKLAAKPSYRVANHPSPSHPQQSLVQFPWLPTYETIAKRARQARACFRLSQRILTLANQASDGLYELSARWVSGPPRR